MTWPRLFPLGPVRREVQVPFRQKIPPGSSEFDIGVPEEWMQDYEFYFSNIHLVPDYFSKLAASYELDPDRELKLEHRYDLKVRVVYDTAKLPTNKDKAAFHLPANQVFSMRKVVAQFNQHFHVNRIKGQRFAPVFLDWTTIATDNPNDMVEEDPEYYFPEGDFSLAGYADGLPDTEIRQYPWVNKYRLPAEDQISNIVLRLCVAPLTTVHMSNMETLEKLGFRKSNLRTTVVHKQNRLRNDKDEWEIFEAANSPDESFQLKNMFKMTVQPCDPIAMLGRDQVVLAIRDWDDTTQVCESVNRALRSVGNVLNLDIKLTYNLAEHKFQFTFPEFFDVTLDTDPELVLRLGYPAGNTMDRRQPVAERDSTIKLVDAQLMAQSLVMDTGNVNVYLTDAPSNTVKGDAGFLMADLYPDPQGLLKPLGWGCPQAATQITTRVKTAERTVQLHFRLGRVYEFGKLDRFEWRTAAYVFGTLAGRPLATV